MNWGCEKCGRKTMHASGLCNLCRTVKCGACGKKMVWGKVRTNICNPCRRAKQAQNRRDGDPVAYTRGRKRTKPTISGYKKQEYLVRLNSGEELVCWPNAGTMNALDGSGRRFWANEIQTYEPMGE